MSSASSASSSSSSSSSATTLPGIISAAMSAMPLSSFESPPSSSPPASPERLAPGAPTKRVGGAAPAGAQSPSGTPSVPPPLLPVSSPLNTPTSSPVRLATPPSSPLLASPGSSPSKLGAWVSPSKQRRWTAEEDERLRKSVGLYGAKNWKKIARVAFGTTKTSVQCLHRWQKVLRPGLVKGPWTPEEDQAVRRLVRKFGTGKWSLIATHLKGRLGKQCRERWVNHLDPNIKKGDWGIEEDRTIIRAHSHVGNRWAKIARVLQGRTDNAVKNRWNSSLRRISRMAAGEPDDFLEELLEQLHARDSSRHSSVKSDETASAAAAAEEEESSDESEHGSDSEATDYHSEGGRSGLSTPKRRKREHGGRSSSKRRRTTQEPAVPLPLGLGNDIGNESLSRELAPYVCLPAGGGLAMMPPGCAASAGLNEEERVAHRPRFRQPFVLASLRFEPSPAYKPRDRRRQGTLVAMLAAAAADAENDIVRQAQGLINDERWVLAP